MNSFFITFLSLGVLASAYTHSYIHGAAPLGPDGRVVDTPEVAHAKAAHFAAKDATHGAYAPAVYAAVPSVYSAAYAYGPAPLGHDGRVVDTPEVAAAKSAHFAATSVAGSHSAYVAAPAVYSAAPAYNSYAYGPAPLGHDGRVVDTPEVAAAKSAHFAATSVAGSHSAYVAAPAVYSAAPAYNSYAYGPAPLGHDGRVVDTAEVAAAKAAHFAAQSASGAHSSWAVPAAAYAHGAAPLAHDGRVVDTPEVAAAKAAHFDAVAHASHY